MAINEDTTVKPDEDTPLIANEPTDTPKYSKSVLCRALICGFMVSLSFGVTQVPLIYVFRLMTCEAYYTTHPESGSGSHHDRCDVPAIEAGTSRSVALLGFSTTLFGVLNLFVTAWTIKKFGIKTALLISVFWPAIRLLVQNIGVMMGGSNGIIVVQCSQILTILGGPAGYLLALNSYVTEVIEASERTGALGKLQGCSFIGLSLAYLAGGILSDAFGIIAPFRVTLMLFLISTCYVILFLPWLPLDKSVATQTSGITKFFGPLKVFTPQKWVLQGGRVKTEYGIILLGIGVFLGVLATGYIPVLLQMYATDIYAFGPTENGYLISLNCFVRGLFLTLVFPPTISAGREWVSKRSTPTLEETPAPGSDIPSLPHSANDFANIDAMDDDEEPIEPPKPRVNETFAFDLSYTKYSLLVDAILTGAASFISQGWQMYLIAVLLPFASGTGAAAKGTILQMCSTSEKTDALSAITLVEMAARLATSEFVSGLSITELTFHIASVFGLVFAAFAEIGQTHLVFTCNAAVALIGFCVLVFARFPADGSERYEEGLRVEES